MKNFLYTTIMIALCAACAHKEPTPAVTETPAASTDPMQSSAPAVTTAQAILKPGQKQKVKGIVHFTQVGDKVKVEAIVEGLKPGSHGIHVHENGECTAPDFKSAGGHFNPTKANHGALDSTDHHVGDMSNIVADKKGKAKISLEVASLSLGGPQSIVGKSFVIHATADDLKTQPSGNSGDRVACGVIESL